MAKSVDGNTNKSGAYDITTHHLLLIKEAPYQLALLRVELALPHNADISERAQKETTFEGSIATIAEMLDIVLDGSYEPAALFEVLLAALKQRGKFASSPHLRHPSLTKVDIEESKGEIRLVEVDEDEGTIIAGTGGVDRIASGADSSLQVTDSETSEEKEQRRIN